MNQPQFLISRIPSSFLGTRIRSLQIFGSNPYRGLRTCPQTHESTQLDGEEEENGRVIRGVVLNVQSGMIDDIVDSLRRDQSCSGMRLTPRLVDGLLVRFGDDWKSALGVFRWACSHSGYEHSNFGYDKMVDLLGKMRQMERMWELVGEMRGQGRITVDTIAKIMRRLCGFGRWKAAVEVFDDLEKVGIERNTETMNILLDTLCKERRTEVARVVFFELKEYIPPNVQTFNIFIHGWCNARKVEEAMWTVQEMKGFGFRPSVITYTTIIQAYCNRFNFRGAREVLDEMVAEGCPPNVVTYTTLMICIAKSREFEAALSILSRVKLSGCEVDTRFYNVLISVLGRAGRVQEASRIFNVEMQMDGVPRNLTTFNTMISIFCNHCQEEDALNVLKEMEGSSFKPDLYTCRPLLRLCLRSQSADDRLYSLLSDIVDKYHLSLDLDSYTLLIHGLCKNDNIEWACRLFEQMIGQEILPTKRTCQLIMHEAELRGINGIVERIKSLMN